MAVNNRPLLPPSLIAKWFGLRKKIYNFLFMLLLSLVFISPRRNNDGDVGEDRLPRRLMDAEHIKWFKVSKPCVMVLCSRDTKEKVLLCLPVTSSKRVWCCFDAVVWGDYVWTRPWIERGQAVRLMWYRKLIHVFNYYRVSFKDCRSKKNFWVLFYCDMCCLVVRNEGWPAEEKGV